MYVAYERRKKNNDIRLKHKTKVPPSRQHFISLRGKWTEHNLTAWFNVCRKKLLNDLLQKLVQMYKCTIANDVKENVKSSSQFHLISCIYVIFVNMEKLESQFFLVIMVWRKWVHYQNMDRFDQAKSIYQIGRKSFCSWKYLWFFCFQAMIINLFILYKKTHPSLPRTFNHSTFKLISAYYLQRVLLGIFQHVRPKKLLFNQCS